MMGSVKKNEPTPAYELKISNLTNWFGPFLFTYLEEFARSCQVFCRVSIQIPVILEVTIHLPQPRKIGFVRVPLPLPRPS